MPSKRVAILVDGCFWHGCPEHYVRPRSRNDFWDRKLRENVDRDRRQTLRLESESWTVLRFWEHEIVEAPERVVAEICRRLTSRRRSRPSWRVVHVDWVDAEAGVERRELEDLRNANRKRVEERKRTTRKVGRVRSRIVR